MIKHGGAIVVNIQVKLFARDSLGNVSMMHNVATLEEEPGDDEVGATDVGSVTDVMPHSKTPWVLPAVNIDVVVTLMQILGAD